MRVLLVGPRLALRLESFLTLFLCGYRPSSRNTCPDLTFSSRPLRRLRTSSAFSYLGSVVQFQGHLPLRPCAPQVSPRGPLSCLWVLSFVFRHLLLATGLCGSVCAVVPVVSGEGSNVLLCRRIPMSPSFSSSVHPFLYGQVSEGCLRVPGLCTLKTYSFDTSFYLRVRYLCRRP